MGQTLGRDTVLECVIMSSPQALYYWEKNAFSDLHIYHTGWTYINVRAVLRPLDLPYRIGLPATIRAVLRDDLSENGMVDE